jgi:cytochrome c553
MVYLRGNTSREIPSCTACHGPIGRGNLAAGYPALRGQQSLYTMKQLNDYAQGTRYSGSSAENHPSPNAYIMTTIAKRLTPEDIRNVASYVQGLR